MTTFLLVACLDIPDTPEPQNTASHVTVYTVQKDNADSTSLKIHPEDPATLKAVITTFFVTVVLFMWAMLKFKFISFQ